MKNLTNIFQLSLLAVLLCAAGLFISSVANAQARPCQLCADAKAGNLSNINERCRAADAGEIVDLKDGDNNDNRTALLLAARGAETPDSPHHEVAIELLNGPENCNPANPNLGNRADRTPFMWAVQNNNTPLARALLNNASGKEGFTSTAAFINRSKSNDNRNALDIALDRKLQNQPVNTGLLINLVFQGGNFSSNPRLSAGQIAALRSFVSSNMADSAGEGMLDAIRAGNAVVVGVLLTLGVSVDYSDGTDTALGVAVDEGHPAIVDILLDFGDTDMETMLIRAIKQGQPSVVRTLLERGANPDIDDSRFEIINGSPWNYRHALKVVWLAPNDTQGMLVSVILEYGNVDLEVANAYMRYAAEDGSAEHLRAYLARDDLDVNQRSSSSGYTALHLAARERNLETVELLLNDSRVLPNIKTTTRWEYGYAALHLAMRHSDHWHRPRTQEEVDVVNEFLENSRVDLNVETDHSVRKTPLWMAAVSYSRPPFHNAHRGRRREVKDRVSRLLAAGADPNVRNSAGDILGRIVRGRGLDYDIATIVIADPRVNVNRVIPGQEPLLHLANIGGSHHMIRLLLENGANMYEDGPYGSPLYNAVRHRNVPSPYVEYVRSNGITATEREEVQNVVYSVTEETLDQSLVRLVESSRYVPHPPLSVILSNLESVFGLFCRDNFSVDDNGQIRTFADWFNREKVEADQSIVSLIEDALPDNCVDEEVAGDGVSGDGVSGVSGASGGGVSGGGVSDSVPARLLPRYEAYNPTFDDIVEEDHIIDENIELWR